MSCMLASQSSAVCTGCSFQGSSQVCTETASQLARLGEQASRARNSLHSCAALAAVALSALLGVGLYALAGRCVTHSLANRTEPTELCAEPHTAPVILTAARICRLGEWLCEHATHCEHCNGTPIGAPHRAVPWTAALLWILSVYSTLRACACTGHASIDASFCVRHSQCTCDQLCAPL